MEQIGYSSNRMYQTILDVDKQGLLTSGQNQIRIMQNGYPMEIRLYINSKGEMMTFDAFVQTSSNPRKMGGNLIILER